MKFFLAFCYLGFISLYAFFLGRGFAHLEFNPDVFPFKTAKFEKDGKIYEKFGIKHWKDKVPDMSKLFYKIVPPKKVQLNKIEELPKLINETCIAELVHISLSFMGFGCIGIWRSWGGLIMSILYFIGNIPFVMIQRYNRPRLQKLYHRCNINNTIIVEGEDDLNCAL